MACLRVGVTRDGSHAAAANRLGGLPSTGIDGTLFAEPMRHLARHSARPPPWSASCLCIRRPGTHLLPIDGSLFPDPGDATQETRGTRRSSPKPRRVAELGRERRGSPSGPSAREGPMPGPTPRSRGRRPTPRGCRREWRPHAGVRRRPRACAAPGPAPSREAPSRRTRPCSTPSRAPTGGSPP